MGVYTGICMAALFSASALSAAHLQHCEVETMVQEKTEQAVLCSFDTARFVLPKEARVLVVVEGTTDSECRVYAFERAGEKEKWEKCLETDGVLGKNGMSSHRHSGDKTTPIGVFQMNTPFGQKEALEGFPADYIQVDASYVWEDAANKLSQDFLKEGERVGSQEYAGYYDYVIDAGFNPNGIADQGSALFLHCKGAFRDYTSGCVAIEAEAMTEILRLYGRYGSGAVFIAQAKAGDFDAIYSSFGSNQGLSPEVPQQEALWEVRESKNGDGEK